MAAKAAGGGSMAVLLGGEERSMSIASSSSLSLRYPAASALAGRFGRGQALVGRFDQGLTLDRVVFRKSHRVAAIVARTGGGGSAPYRPPFRKGRPNSRQQSPEEGPSDRQPINGEISAPMVRMIGDDGKMIGIIPVQEALKRAMEDDLDLVQIDNQDPPCVKMIDFSKYRYELQRKKKEQQKKNAANRIDVKELKMRYNIDEHDYSVRLRAAERFLKDGDKVKLIVQFRGREMDFKDIAIKRLQRFQDELGELATVESKITTEGRSITSLLAPNKTKAEQRAQSPPLTSEKAKPKPQDSEKPSPAPAVVESV